LRVRNIGVEVFKPESKLIAIDPLRPSPKLRPLEPQNDGPEALHLSLRPGKLCLIARNVRSQVTHQMVQRIDAPPPSRSLHLQINGDNRSCSSAAEQVCEQWTLTV
jgi:hypothetical protein